MEDEHADWTPYQRMEAGILKDISHDTDTILDKLEDMNMGEGFDSGMLTGLMANRGIDPSIVAMLNDRCRDGNWGWGDGGMLTLLFLIILLGGRGGFGFGADGAGVAGVDRTVVNEANYSRLYDAVSTSGTRQEMAIQSLASALNCDVQTINSALCGIDKQLAINHGDFINAIQSCCCNLQSKIQECCCQTNLNIERQGCQTRNDIQETRFLIQTTNDATKQYLDNKIDALALQVERGFCAQETRELQNRIHALEDQNNQLRTEAQSAVLLNAINGTKCVNARYDTTTQTICGSVGARNCCCNRAATAATPATTETPTTEAVLEAETAPVKSKKAKAE